MSASSYNPYLFSPWLFHVENFNRRQDLRKLYNFHVNKMKIVTYNKTCSAERKWKRGIECSSSTLQGGSNSRCLRNPGESGDIRHGNQRLLRRFFSFPVGPDLSDESRNRGLVLWRRECDGASTANHLRRSISVRFNIRHALARLEGLRRGQPERSQSRGINSRQQRTTLEVRNFWRGTLIFFHPSKIYLFFTASTRFIDGM